MLDIYVKEEFYKLLGDKTKPFDWTYFEYYDDGDDQMDYRNTSIIHGYNIDNITNE
jgi:hypothetical protein